MNFTSLVLRPATQADLPAINDIYNYYVSRSTCTYQYEESTAGERQAWFAQHGTGHPVIVAESDDIVVGWGALSPFREREAYRRTVENSIYVRHDLQRRGIGIRLLENLILSATVCGHHVIMAVIDGEQAGSIALHGRHGFEEVGRLCEVGFKFGRWLNVVYMERKVGKD